MINKNKLVKMIKKMMKYNKNLIKKTQINKLVHYNNKLVKIFFKKKYFISINSIHVNFI